MPSDSRPWCAHKLRGPPLSDAVLLDTPLTTRGVLRALARRAMRSKAPRGQGELRGMMKQMMEAAMRDAADLAAADLLRRPAVDKAFHS